MPNWNKDFSTGYNYSRV